MTEILQVHDLTFELRRSSKRKSIAIIIDRRGELILSAPEECPRERIQRTAEEKYRWIYTRLAKKEMLFRPPRPKEFLTGESFSYLGYPYRLQIVLASRYDHDTPPLQFQGGWFLLREDERAHGWEHFSRWYGEQGFSWLEQRVSLFVDRIEARPQAITIQDLGYRWGSCSRSRILNFHWRVIQLPPMIIDYLVVHELVHLHERSHNTEFWRRVEQTLPDFAERKAWLAENGSQF